MHDYFAHYDRPYAHSAGVIDGSFASLYNMGTNHTKAVYDAYAIYAPDREPVISFSEWGDFSVGEEEQFDKYQGGMLTAHVLYRAIKNKHLLNCEWGTWNDSDDPGCMFSGYPAFNPRPRYFPYVMYKNFGSTQLECYDMAEYTPGVTDFFFDYKDDHDDLLTQASVRDDGNIAIMAINLSQETTYQASISMDNFNMTGEITAYVMNQSNCYEGGPGPSSSTVLGNTNPFNFEFKPFTVTCLIVKGATIPDSTAPTTISQVRDGTGTDIDNVYTTRLLRANWTKTTDLQSGVSRYWYSIGTLAGSTDVAGWTDNGVNRSVPREGLTLQDGHIYYFTSVR